MNSYTMQIGIFFEKVLMFSTIISLLFIVNNKTKWFSISSLREKVFFFSAVLLLIGYYIGWIFYFNGYQSRLLVLIMLVSFIPLYYTCIGLWRRNPVLVGLGITALFVHVANVWVSY